MCISQSQIYTCPSCKWYKRVTYTSDVLIVKQSVYLTCPKCGYEKLESKSAGFDLKQFVQSIFTKHL